MELIYEYWPQATIVYFFIITGLCLLTQSGILKLNLIEDISDTLVIMFGGLGLYWLLLMLFFD